MIGVDGVLHSSQHIATRLLKPKISTIEEWRYYPADRDPETGYVSRTKFGVSDWSRRLRQIQDDISLKGGHSWVVMV